MSGALGRWSGVLIAALGWAGCAGELPDGFSLHPEPTEADGGASAGPLGTAAAPTAPAATMFAADAAPACPDVPTEILSPACATAGCHSAAAKSEGLDLESADVYARLAGAPALEGSGLLIDPSEAASSVLYTKLLANPPFGARMPSGGALDDATVACVLSWLSGGGSAVVDAGGSDASDAAAAPVVSCPTSVASAVGPYIVQCPVAAATTAASSVSVTLAQPPVAGDLEVAIVAESAGGPSQITPPPAQGWSEDASCEAVRAGSNGLRFFSRTVGANEGASAFVFASSPASGLAVALYEIASPAGTPALDGCVVALDPKDSSSATSTTPSFTPTAANELALAAALSSLSPQPTTPTVTSGWTVDTWSTNDDQYVSLATAHEVAAASSATPVAPSFTFSAAAVFQQSVLVLFK